MLNLFFALTSFAAQAQILDCASNLRSITPNRSFYGVRDGTAIELRPISRTIERISVVVPVYREFANGNLFSLLAALGRQTLPSRDFNVVLVVNNSRDASQRQDAAFRENQATLRWLGAHHADFPFDLKVLDHSTNGMVPNMGVLRHVGALAALDPWVNAHNHVLVSMDADTGFAPDHLARLRDYYQRFDVDVVLSRFKFAVRDPRDLKTFLSHRAHHGQLRHSQFRRALAYAQKGAGTPQLSVLAARYREIGGFPPLAESEDYGMMRRLAKLKTLYAPDLFVVTEDRARGDGFDARRRESWNEAYDWDREIPRSKAYAFEELFGPAFKREIAKVSLKRISPYQGTVNIQRLLERKLSLWIPPLVDPGWFSHHEAEGAPAFDAWAMCALFQDVIDFETERAASTMLRVLMNSTDPQVAERLHRKLDLLKLDHLRAATERREYLASWLEGRATATDSKDQFIGFIRANASPLHDLFVGLRAEFGGKKDAMGQLSRIFPDWLGFWEEAHHVRTGVMFELAEDLVLSGFHDPDRYPGLKYLRR